jgi:hypothetical protein
MSKKPWTLSLLLALVGLFLAATSAVAQEPPAPDQPKPEAAAEVPATAPETVAQPKPEEAKPGEPVPEEAKPEEPKPGEPVPECKEGEECPEPVPECKEGEECPEPVPECKEGEECPKPKKECKEGEECPEDCEGEACAASERFKDFVKGELLSVGTTDLLGTRSRAGAKVGYRAIGFKHYGTVDPGVDLRFGKFHLGLSAPLNIELWDGSAGLVSIDAVEQDVGVKGFDNVGQIRQEDWDNWRDYFRVLNHAGWGRKEDFFFVNIAQEGAASIGHGLIMKRYMPQIDIDTSRVGMQMDAYLDWLGGFEFYTNDITNWNMLGALAFVKPLAPFTTGFMGRSLSIGFTFVTDTNAPRFLQKANKKGGTVGGDIPTKYQRIALDPNLNDTVPLALETVAVSIWGIDTEIKLVKTKGADIKVYVDYSNMVDGGWGGAMGALGRFNAGTKIINAFRLRLEGRAFTGNYEPSYFDSFYEIDRWQFLTGLNGYGSNGAGDVQTKYDAITSHDDAMAYGYFAEAAYSILGIFSLGAALEGQTVTDRDYYNLLVHLDIPASEFVRLKGTYQKRHFEDFGQAFKFSEDNEWLSAVVRVKLLEILYLNGQVGHLWSLNRESFDRGNLGPEYGLYKAGWDWRIWADVALEF